MPIIELIENPERCPKCLGAGIHYNMHIQNDVICACEAGDKLINASWKWLKNRMLEIKEIRVPNKDNTGWDVWAVDGWGLHPSSIDRNREVALAKSFIQKNQLEYIEDVLEQEISQPE